MAIQINTHFLKIALIATSIFCTSAIASAAPTLSKGAEGQEVSILQETLKNAGYKIPKVDGIYGSDTEKAVAEFQRDNQIKITGKVNNATWRKLKKIVKPKDITSTENGKSRENTNLLILKKDKVPALIELAKSHIGVPYKYGGNTPKGFDCSGYLEYIFKQQNITIPRTADEQYKLGTKVKKTKYLVQGDLVFFAEGKEISHCGIYLGKGKFIHASTSKGVRIDELSNSYWKPRYIGGKHIIQ